MLAPQGSGPHHGRFACPRHVAEVPQFALDVGWRRLPRVTLATKALEEQSTGWVELAGLVIGQLLNIEIMRVRPPVPARTVSEICEANDRSKRGS